MIPCKVNIDEVKMTEILKSLSKAVRYPILFYGFESRRWICTSKKNSPFCYALERNSTTNKLCCASDDHAHDLCQTTREPYLYYCHANLLEIICPVYFKDIYTGFLVIGQFRTRKKSFDPDYMQELSVCSGIQKDILIQKYKNLPVISEEAAQGIKLFETLCVQHLIERNVFTLNEHEVIGKIESYIQKNIRRSMTLKEIAGHVYLNPSYLSFLYKSVTGRNLISYIQEQKIAAACLLIRTTELSFAEVAQETGFRDANYFTKVFKKEMLLTPSQYRGKWKSGEAISEQ